MCQYQELPVNGNGMNIDNKFAKQLRSPKPTALGGADVMISSGGEVNNRIPHHSDQVNPF
jgi:hypothetical protein